MLEVLKHVVHINKNMTASGKQLVDAAKAHNTDNIQIN